MKNKIINGSVIVMIFTIASKVVALLRDSLMASNFGTGTENSIFTFSMRSTMLLVSIGYGLTMAIVPVYSKLDSNNKGKECEELVNNTITVSTIFAAIIVVIAVILAGPIVKVMASDIAMNPVYYSQAVSLLRIMFISIIFVAPQSILAGVLQCNNKFIAPASMSLCSNLVYLIYQVFLLKIYGIMGYGVAVVIGFFIMFAVNVPAYRKLGYRYKFSFNLKDRGLRKIGESLFPIVLSSSLVQISLYILTAIGASVDSSSIVILDYSNKMTMMFYEVFAIAINMVTYPLLSSLKAQNEMGEYKGALIKSVKYILIVLLPVSIGLAILRLPVMAAYLMRGEFTFESVERTSSFLLFMIPTILILSIKDILLRCFFSLDNNRIVLKNSIATIVLTFIITYPLRRMIGENSLAIGYTLTGIVTMIMLYYPLKKEIALKINAKDLKDLLKIVIATIIMSVPVYLIYNLFTSYFALNTKNSILIIGICGIFGVLIYLIALITLRVDEVKEIINMIKNR